MPRTKKTDLDRAKRRYLIKVIISIENIGYDAQWLLEIPYKKIDYLKLRKVFIEDYLPKILQVDGYDSIDEWKIIDGSWIDAPLNNFVNFYG
jgi:hypothetical protein